MLKGLFPGSVESAPSAAPSSGQLFDEPPEAFSIDALLRRRPELSKAIGYNAILIAREVEGHVGQARAIRIRDLVSMLGEGWDDRKIKSEIERLRTLARMPIASTKVPPYGLFMPATPEEARETHDRLFGEGIRLILHSQLFGRDRDLVRKLEGQLELKQDSSAHKNGGRIQDSGG